MQFTIDIPLEIPSQNVRERWHWSRRQREIQLWKEYFMYEKLKQKIPETKERRAVDIIAHRKRRISDTANLIGGCKGMIDAMVRAKLLFDDSDMFAKFNYDQALAENTPKTVIRITTEILHA